MQQQSAVAKKEIAGEEGAVPGFGAIAAALVGNGLEWYNFVAYVLFATIIAKRFFPTGNPLSALLLTLGTFSLGFFARPLGALLLGAYSDRVGRKAALSLAILLMCIGTAMIALMPPYATIGVAAPLLLLVGRLMQGFSAGGEVGASAAFMREFAPPGRRGFYVSWLYSSTNLCIALGLAVGTVVSLAIGHGVLGGWGWRIPFLFGLVIGPVGYVLRRRVVELPEHRQTHHRTGTPFRDVITKHSRETLASAALITLSTICTYVLLAYTPIYSVRTLHLPQSAGFIATMVGTVTAGLAIPVAGLGVDRFGPRVLLRTAAALMVLLAYPMFLFINAAPGLWTLIIFQLVFGLVIGLYQGPLLTGICDMFSTRALATGIGLADSIAVACFGGTAALVITYLIALTGNHMVPAFYLIVAALAGLAGTLPLRR